MHQSERRRRILQILDQHPTIRVRELVELLRASEATVRRDIVRLTGEGAIRRVRGGAKPLDPAARRRLQGQPRFADSRFEQLREKRSIAASAAALCERSDSVIVSGGTTTFALAEALADSGVHVLTNALHHAEVLLRSGKNRVIMLGGELVGEQGVVVSPFRWSEIEGYYATKIFIGAQAIGPSGVLQTDPNLARCEQRLMAQAERVVVLADSSKFHKHAPVVVAPLDEIDVIITDAGIDAESLAMLQSTGVEVVVQGGTERETSAA